jgi:hypothetical protein
MYEYCEPLWLILEIPSSVLAVHIVYGHMHTRTDGTGVVYERTKHGYVFRAGMESRDRFATGDPESIRWSPAATRVKRQQVHKCADAQVHRPQRDTETNTAGTASASPLHDP